MEENRTKKNKKRHEEEGFRSLLSRIAMMYALVCACGIRQKMSWYGSHLPIRARLIYAARLGHGTMTLLCTEE